MATEKNQGPKAALDAVRSLLGPPTLVTILPELPRSPSLTPFIVLALQDGWICMEMDGWMDVYRDE